MHDTDTQAPRTLAEAMARAAARLVSAGRNAASARVDARVLARHAFGLDEAGLILREPEAPRADALGHYQALVDRRSRHEPVAYILGTREFYGRDFAVGPGVLIPRPETELLVDLALAKVPDPAAGVEIVDVGTGSGCVAVTLACELPRARIVATDVSGDALAIARENAAAQGVANRVVFQQVDLVPQVDQVDLVVSNPPYVPSRHRPGLSPDVRDFEPGVALFGGADGLDLIRALVGASANVLRRDTGWLLFEFGYGQDEEVQQLLEADRRYADVTLTHDLQGIPRVASARRRAVPTA